jgi:hypothetical protein
MTTEEHQFCEREFHARCLGYCGDDLLDIIDKNVQEMTCDDCTELLSGEDSDAGSNVEGDADNEEGDDDDDDDV